MSDATFRIDVYHHLDPSPLDLKVDQILTALGTVLEQEQTMSQELDTLTAKVTETVTVEQSAIELLNGLSAQIAALKTDPAALQGLADSLAAKSSELAAAVVANTPA